MCSSVPVSGGVHLTSTWLPKGEGTLGPSVCRPLPRRATPLMNPPNPGRPLRRRRSPGPAGLVLIYRGRQHNNLFQASSADHSIFLLDLFLHRLYFVVRPSRVSGDCRCRSPPCSHLLSVSTLSITSTCAADVPLDIGLGVVEAAIASRCSPPLGGALSGRVASQPSRTRIGVIILSRLPPDERSRFSAVV